MKKQRQWSSREACLRYMRLEGWITGVAVCHKCRNVWDTAYPPGCNPNRLECPRCRKQDSTVIPEP